MKPVIVRNIERPDADLVRKLGEFGVATVHEAQGRTGLMLPYMRPIYPAARIAAPAVTVYSHPGDNLMIHAALEMCRKGDVLVVTTKSESTDGMFGELLATSCQANGIAGVVIEAGVRDVADITAMQFPVFSKAISSMGTVKETAGSVNIEVVCAGAIVHPGDIIVADIDGVVVVPRRDAAEVVRLSEERLAKEARSRELLKSGKLGLDMYGLRDKLKALGVEYLDRAPE
jgi:4-hydroxy-4-methyl-2-oxoglutarate aldolase